MNKLLCKNLFGVKVVSIITSNYFIGSAFILEMAAFCNVQCVTKYTVHVPMLYLPWFSLVEVSGAASLAHSWSCVCVPMACHAYGVAARGTNIQSFKRK